MKLGEHLRLVGAGGIDHPDQEDKGVDLGDLGREQQCWAGQRHWVGNCWSEDRWKVKTTSEDTHRLEN